MNSRYSKANSGLLLAICGVLLSPVGTARADEKLRKQVVAKGIEFMQKRGQSADGSVSPRIGIGLTALAAHAMIRNEVPLEHPSVAKAMKIVAGAARENGGIYPDNSRLMMYETCVAMMCLKEANKSGKYDTVLAKAAAFVKGEQFTNAKGIKESDLEYGGAGYGGKSRPDLSNTAYLIDALKAMDSEEHDEAIQAALTFVSRCQNLESAHNTTKDAAKVDDGGFYYNITESSSAAGKTDEGGLRSYGSMTYAGFKSMLHAGLKEDDPRVAAALTWIRDHYTVTENPGLGDAGLYYYYHLFAKSLSTAGIDTLQDEDGVEHNWREELVVHLAKLQGKDGSWTNSNERWMESDPNLATTFSLLALSYCKQ